MSLSPSLERTPELDAWVQIHDGGTLTVFTGKAELGQKIKIAIATIAAEELDVEPERIRVGTADTKTSPNEMYTGGSNSMEESGNAVRQAAVHARKILLEKAADHLGEPVQNLIVHDGIVSGQANDKRVSYWDLMADTPFQHIIDKELPAKDPSQYRLIGKPVAGFGFEGLVTGATPFLHDLEMPGMVHARSVRPPHYLAVLKSVDDAPVRAMAGVIEVVRDGSFLAVCAEREEQAIWAAAKLESLAEWDLSKRLNSQTSIYDQLVSNPRESLRVIDGVAVDDPLPPAGAPAGLNRVLSATYLKPYIMHASMAPSAAIAHFTDEDHLHVWSHSQGVYPMRAALADVLEMPVENIEATHAPGPGCYGHNAAEDAATDAALVARAVVGRPVLLKWSREDEHAWEPYGSAMRVEMLAGVGEDGKIAYWSHDAYSDTQVARPGSNGAQSQLMPAWYLKKPFPQPPTKPNRGPNFGVHRNADPIYSFPEKRIGKHLVKELPLRVSALRALAAYGNIFALESFMDEVAHAEGKDPLEFRLSHLQDTRARDVLEAAAAKANWQNRDRSGETGHGLAVARYKNAKAYAAVYINLSVDDVGEIILNKAVIAADSGQIVDPEGLRSQMEGGLIQSASWTLKEEVTFDSGGITSRDWETYPILGFDNIPEIETVLLNRPDQPFLGSGEATMGPTVAAIGNAVYDAIGIRMRQTPFTGENVRAAAAAD